MQLLRYGGLSAPRAVDLADPFEGAVERALGSEVRASSEWAKALWQALRNQPWVHRDGTVVLYTFRAAGDLVAALRGSGTYLDWYCCGPEDVAREIRSPMRREGWRPLRMTQAERFVFKTDKPPDD